MWDYLPEWKSPLGLCLIGLVIYLISWLVAYIASPRLNKVVNFEERVRRQIIEDRKRTENWNKNIMNYLWKKEI